MGLNGIGGFNKSPNFPIRKPQKNSNLDVGQNNGGSSGQATTDINKLLTNLDVGGGSNNLVKMLTQILSALQQMPNTGNNPLKGSLNNNSDGTNNTTQTNNNQKDSNTPNNDGTKGNIASGTPAQQAGTAGNAGNAGKAHEVRTTPALVAPGKHKPDNNQKDNNNQNDNNKSNNNQKNNSEQERITNLLKKIMSFMNGLK